MNNVPPPLPPTRSWWQRHWPWAVPTGCVTLLALLAVFVVGIVTVVMAAMKSSDAYKTAVQQAEKNAQVINALGTPITEGWILTGNINVAGGSGHADLAIPIAGPKGKAAIYVVANKSEGAWIYSTLKVHVNSTGETIDVRGRTP